MASKLMNSSVCAVVVTENNVILPYTCKTTMSQCEEKCIERWGTTIWDKMKSLGCKVVQAEIRLYE